MSESALARLTGHPRFGELIGVLVLGLALFCMLSLLSYDSADQNWFQLSPQGVPTQNWLGQVGATLAEALLQGFGAQAFFLPWLIALAGWRRLRSGENGFSYPELVGHLALTLALCSLLSLFFGRIGYGGHDFAAGGYIGTRLAVALQTLLSTTGAVLISLAGVVVVVLLLTRRSSLRTAELAVGWGAHGARSLRAAWGAWRERRRSVVRRPTPLGAEARRSAAPSGRSESPSRETRPTITTGAAATSRRAAASRHATIPVEERVKKAQPRQASLPMDPGKRGFALPPLDLLSEPREEERENEQELLERAEQITSKLQQFSIDGAVVAIHPGPVVTTFEFKPEAGVKYAKITGMTDDLCLALKAESVRIDRLPGRSTVGIEVPNRNQETIYPRELIGSERYRDTRSKLVLALGKDIHGEVYCAELERMPHLLIAGATGAGKSVGLNGMIISLLYRATPLDLRFIMIDTKMIELGIYADIPHLLIPVVTDPKTAATALQWAVREMELRYRKLASVGLRNIGQFNALVKEEPERTMEDPRGGDPIPLTHLPYIVIVVDELADLMMISSAEVESSIMRLAQMARAVGLHLILATQRPSVDIITGTIKANFPSRIAFRVSQRVDSRTIIDQQGAEHLLGRGDMLLLPTGSSRVTRLHSGYITEPEINRVTSFLKKVAEPQYDASVLAESTAAPGVADHDRDEMYADAVRTVVHEGKCSITLIQRRLQLGYARAARIVDMMEQQGVVSAGEGSKPREVLVDADILETLDNGARPGA